MIRAYKKKYHFIYKTTNQINGSFYVGMHSTSNLDDGYIGSGKRLRYSVNKYGRENFKTDILEMFESREELVSRERELVNESLLKDPLCMNMRLGGEGGFEHLTKEQKSENGKRVSAWLKEKFDSDTEFREEWSRKSSERIKGTHKEGKLKYDNFAGKKHSEETLEKMREAKVNHGLKENNSQYGTCWVYQPELKENKKIKKEELDTFVTNGWVKGRKYF